MSVSFLVPLGGFDHDRRQAWSWLEARLSAEWPDAEIVVGDAVPYTKGAALADAATRASGSTVVVHDADLYVSERALRRSIDAVELDGAAWSMPHGDVYRLSPMSTMRLYGGSFDPTPRPIRPSQLHRPGHAGPAGGGIVVTTRAAWDATGIDPRFDGWGGDDISFARALETLAGPCARFDAPMIHLWHNPMERLAGNRGSPENELLAGAYLDAAGHPDAMRELIAGRSTEYRVPSP